MKHEEPDAPMRPATEEPEDEMLNEDGGMPGGWSLKPRPPRSKQDKYKGWSATCAIADYESDDDKHRNCKDPSCACPHWIHSQSTENKESFLIASAPEDVALAMEVVLPQITATLEFNNIDGMSDVSGHVKVEGSVLFVTRVLQGTVDAVEEEFQK